MVLIAIVKEYFDVLDKNVLIAIVKVTYTHRVAIEVVQVIANVTDLINATLLQTNA